MQRDLLRLGHILDAGEAILRAVNGVSADELRENDDLLEAVLWRFTKLGEAVYQLSDELREKYPDVEWAGAMATRNRVVHGYFDIDASIIFNAATTSVPRFFSLPDCARERCRSEHDTHDGPTTRDDTRARAAPTRDHPDVRNEVRGQVPSPPLGRRRRSRPTLPL